MYLEYHFELKKVHVCMPYIHADIYTTTYGHDKHNVVIECLYCYKPCLHACMHMISPGFLCGDLNSWSLTDICIL